MWSHTEYCISTLVLLHKKGSGQAHCFYSLNKETNRRERKARSFGSETSELPSCSQVRRGKKHQVFSHRLDAAPNATHSTEGCRIFESGLAAGTQLWELQESRCRNLGLCFRNIPWKVSGPAARRSEIPHLICSAAGLGDPKLDVPA